MPGPRAGSDGWRTSVGPVRTTTTTTTTTTTFRAPLAPGRRSIPAAEPLPVGVVVEVVVVVLVTTPAPDGSSSVRVSADLEPLWVTISPPKGEREKLAALELDDLAMRNAWAAPAPERPDHPAGRSHTVGGRHVYCRGPTPDHPRLSLRPAGRSGPA
jgi:hypothetical protein